MINALAILNEQRFLKPRGWHSPDFNRTESSGAGFLKQQMIFLTYTARTLGRYILIPTNALVILFELIMG